MPASHPTKSPISARSKGLKQPRAKNVPIRSLPDLTPHDVERFWEKIDPREGPEACWPWIAALCAQGYGRFKLERRLYGAHRIALYLSDPDRADLNRSLYALHSCDNPSCCNPAHLAWGTPLLNAQQASQRGRLVRAPKCSPASSESRPVARGKANKAPLPLDVECPACRATPGSACMNSSRTWISPHIQRWNAVGIAHPSLDDRRRNYLDLKRRRPAA